jgi:hypothetical protein
MPLLPKSELKEYAKLVGETEFAIPDSNDVEMVKLLIYYGAPIFMDDKLTEEFGDKSADIKSQITAMEPGVLLSKLNNGEVTLPDVQGASVTLKESVHFWSNVKAKRAAAAATQ